MLEIEFNVYKIALLQIITVIRKYFSRESGGPEKELAEYLGEELSREAPRPY